MVGFVVATSWVVARHVPSRECHVSSELARWTAPSGVEEPAALSTNEARSISRSHGLGFVDSKPKRKVHDLVLMSTEFDWLEIRLPTSAPHVDYFILVESPATFAEKPKPLHLKENWHLFEAFHHKIIYRGVYDPIVSSRIWDHEDYFRDSLLTEVFPSLVGSAKEAKPGDVPLVSDMDKIVRPGAMLLLRCCDIPARLILRTHFYYYSFQWLHRGP